MKTVLAVVVLAACSGSSQTPAQAPVLTNSTQKPPPDAALDASVTDAAAVLAKMTAFRDQLCACKDPACAERITGELTRWAQEIAREPREEQRLTEADTRQIAEISEGFARCMARISGTGSGSPP
ncbi:MAG TPA: hypothetical protein VFD36_01645 [Kofleriaceae bacterium]|jgi:hypothetical protein|nr:hypothetical protein [Kofleriaceae bacterium]